MKTLIKIELFSLNAITLMDDIFTLIYSSLAFTNSLLFLLGEGIILYGGLFPDIYFILIFQAWICLTSAFILLSRAIFLIVLLGPSFFFDIRRAFLTTLSIFKPYNIFMFIFYICFIGMVSDLFICLPFNTQMSIIIIVRGILVEIYDNKKPFILTFINNVLDNKTYYGAFALFRVICYFLFINIVVTIFIYIDFLPLNYYILPYLQRPLLSKLLTYSILGEILSWFGEILTKYFWVHSCDTSGDWNRFSRSNPTVVMPRVKYNTLFIFDPDVDRSRSLLQVRRIDARGNRTSLPFWFGSYHSCEIEVYGPHGTTPVKMRPWPLPKCEGFYWRGTGRVYISLDTTNTNHADKPLYLINSNGEYVLTPFKMQRGLKKI